MMNNMRRSKNNLIHKNQLIVVLLTENGDKVHGTMETGQGAIFTELPVTLLPEKSNSLALKSRVYVKVSNN